LDPLPTPIIATAAFLAGSLVTWVFARQSRALAIARIEGTAAEVHAAEMSSTNIRLAAAEEKCSRLPELTQEIAEADHLIAALQREHVTAEKRISALEAQLDRERAATREKLEAYDEARLKLSDTFSALCGEALRQNNQTFLDLARGAFGQLNESARGDLEKRQQAIDGLVAPVRDSLDKVETRISDLEKARIAAYESLSEQVRALTETQRELRGETGQLVKALRSPAARGRWGEIQLRRVVELAGMVDHCDFCEQVSSSDGRMRPDLVVRLPGEKQIVIDSKTSLQAYLEALEAPDEVTRNARLQQHAAQVRAHIDQLSRKAYWEQFEPTPEFVVLFLPGEMLFGAALERDPQLIEYGADRRIILATPTTLIALLRAVFYGWRQEKLSANAREIGLLGRELFKRLGDMTSHLDRLGRSLGTAVESYNRTAASLESRVLVTARRFQELDAAPSDAPLPAPPVLELTPRPLSPDALAGCNDTQSLGLDADASLTDK
jgi:DNA recombination protein RmuC